MGNIIWHGVSYAQKGQSTKEERGKSECEQRIDSANRELKRLTETAYECRVNFIRSFTAIEKHKETIIKWLVMFAGCDITDYYTYNRAYINSEIGADEKRIMWMRRNGGSLSPRTSVRR